VYGPHYQFSTPGKIEHRRQAATSSHQKFATVPGIDSKAFAGYDFPDCILAGRPEQDELRSRSFRKALFPNQDP